MTQEYPDGMLLKFGYVANVEMASGQTKPQDRWFIGAVKAFTPYAGYTVKVVTRGNSAKVQDRDVCTPFKLLKKRPSVVPVCPEQIFSEGLSRPCHREMKKPEQVEANLCGIHLGHKKRAQRKGEEERQRLANLRQADDEFQVFVDRFNLVCDASAVAGYGRRSISLSVADARQLMAHVLELEKK